MGIIDNSGVCISTRTKIPDKQGQYLVAFRYIGQSKILYDVLRFLIYEDGIYEWEDMPQTKDYTGFHVLAWRQIPQLKDEDI